MLVEQVLRDTAGKSPEAAVLPTELVVRGSSRREHYAQMQPVDKTTHKRARARLTRSEL